MPGVGHFPPEEDPAAFTEALLAWLGPPTDR
jgi:pimeloyl-ACP methyl ester carboxylesterase